MSNLSEVQMRNQVVLDQLQGTPDMIKQAEDTVSEFTRARLREEGFARKILPPLAITNDDLTRQVDTDKPVVVVDFEPGSPAASSIPFGTLPFNEYIQGPRYRVFFDRIVTPRFTKDVDELRTWQMDIRQVISDNAIKDMMTEEDGKIILTVNNLLGVPDAPGAIIPETGVAQFVEFDSELSREAFIESKKILPRTPSHFTPTVMLMNNVTVLDLEKWGRDEMGGDISQEIMQNGFSERKLAGVDIMVTIKRDLIPDNYVYQFCEANKTGKFFTLVEPTMYIDRKAFMLEFYAYESIGGCIANKASIAVAKFNPEGSSFGAF